MSNSSSDEVHFAHTQSRIFNLRSLYRGTVPSEGYSEICGIQCMSEYQNRAVELLIATIGEETILDSADRRIRFLRQAIELFQAMGGSAQEASAVVSAAMSTPAPVVSAKLGDLMSELAGIGYAHDIDMIQAAYNTLDQGWQRVTTMETGKTA
jgi:hypothetical protein